MHRTILRRLYRDRRRYLICLALLFAAGFTTFWGVQNNQFGPLMPVAGGLAFMVGIGAFMPVLCLLIPSWRFACETVAATLFAQTLLGHLIPSFSLLERDKSQTIWFIVAAMLVLQVYGGTGLDRYWKLKTYRRRTRACSRLDLHTLFDGLAGRPERPEALAYADSTIRFERSSEDPTHLILEIQSEPLGSVVEHHHLRKDRPPYHRTFDWTVDNPGTTAAFLGGSISLDILDRGRFRRIEHVAGFDRYPARGALMTWIDDGFGRFLDDWIGELERRARKGATPALAVPAE